ncbi:MAG: hypothetical protein ACM3OF_01975 [Gemmatimonas sp.]|jgi:hypothetical protein
MSKETDKQQNAVASKPAATGKTTLHHKRGQVEDQRWVQDALEDDDVREALKALHSRDKSK